jgi:hypothetical protein
MINASQGQEHRMLSHGLSWYEYRDQDHESIMPYII